MPIQCFTKKGSSPPVCGVHSVPLIEHESTDDSITSRFGDFIFLVCPISGQVIEDAAKDS
jgi:hypothetical protein